MEERQDLLAKDEAIRVLRGCKQEIEKHYGVTAIG